MLYKKRDSIYIYRSRSAYYAELSCESNYNQGASRTPEAGNSPDIHGAGHGTKLPSLLQS